MCMLMHMHTMESLQREVTENQRTILYAYIPAFEAVAYLASVSPCTTTSSLVLGTAAHVLLRPWLLPGGLGKLGSEEVCEIALSARS